MPCNVSDLRRLNPTSVFSFSLGFLLLSSTAWSQNVGSTTGQNTNVAGVEQVIVTGTNIAGTPVVGSAVVTLSPEDIKASGAIDAVQAVRDLPVVFNQGVTSDSRQGNGGSFNYVNNNSVNILGLSTLDTLTLFNGHRVVAQGLQGEAVNPDIIPAIAIQRIDIQADGASAIYGSDAVTGVANFIMRRNVKDLELSASGGEANHFNQEAISAMSGYDWDGGNVMLAYQYKTNSTLTADHRSWFGDNQTAKGYNNYDTDQCNPGNIVVNGVEYAIPASGVTKATASSLVANTVNKCDPNSNMNLVPPSTINSVVMDFNQSVTDWLSVWGDGFLYKASTYQNGPANPVGSGSSSTVTSANPYFVAPPGVTATSETVNFSLYSGIPGISQGQEIAWNGTVGADVKLPYGWKLSTDYVYGHDDNRTWNGKCGAPSTAYPTTYSCAAVVPGSTGIYATALSTALASTNVATAYNPFVPSQQNNQSVLDSILDAPGYGGPSHFTSRYLDVNASGPLFELPGGEVSGAIGYQNQHLTGTMSTGTFSGNNTISWGHESYHGVSVNSMFGEINVPIVSDENSMRLIRKLDVDAAIRRDEYSTVGATTNPKIGINWTISDGLILRGTYGSSFRAPNFLDLYGAQYRLVTYQLASPTCGGCILNGIRYYGLPGNLKPETANSFTVGVDLGPELLQDFLPGFTAKLTYFNINYKNELIANAVTTNLLYDPGLVGSGLYTYGAPSAATIAAQSAVVLANGGMVGALPANPAFEAFSSTVNLAGTKASGLQFQGNYAVSTKDYGDLIFSLSSLYFLNYTVQESAKAQPLSYLGYINYNQQWKGRIGATWDFQPVTWSTFLNFTSSYWNIGVTPYQRVEPYLTVSTHIAYDLADFSGKPWAHGASIALDVQNLLNVDPPFVAGASAANMGGGGFDPRVGNPIGRLVSIMLTKNIDF